MKIDSLNLIHDALSQRPNIISRCYSVDVLYYQNKSWIKLKDNSEHHIPLTVDARKHIVTQEDPYALSSTHYLFPILEKQIAISCFFKKSPQRRTRNKISREINAALVSADHVYRATHDSLTDLLDDSGLQDFVEDVLQQVNVATRPQSNVNEPSIRQITNLSLIMFDLDKFKSVNDRFGHLYGDLVLYCFGRRLERFSRLASQNEQNTIIHFCVCRRSGEEFCVFLAGNYSKDDETRISDYLKIKCTLDPFPTPDELTEFRKKKAISLSVIPHESDRRVTASAGISRHTLGLQKSSKSLNANELVQIMSEQSDTALIKAKMFGRDRVIHYNDILYRYGSVMSHDADFDVYVLDIGSRHNVIKNDVFVIFTKKYYGDSDFVYSDGRSQRNLGKYPKIPSAIIEVIDSQDEISFCRSRIQFPHATDISGSIAELFHYGEISYFYNFAVPYQNLRSFLDNPFFDLGEQDVCLSFKFSGARFRRYSGHVYETALEMREIVEKAEELFSRANLVYDDSRPILSVVFSNDNSEMIEKATSFIDYCKKKNEINRHPDSIKYCTFSKSTFNDIYDLDGREIVLLSNVLLDTVQDFDSSVEPVSFDTFPNIFFKNREKWRSQLIEKFGKSLFIFGVIDSSIANQLAIMLGINGKTHLAFKLSRWSTCLDPSNMTFIANSAYFAYSAGEETLALEIYSGTKILREIEDVADVHVGPILDLLWDAHLNGEIHEVNIVSVFKKLADRAASIYPESSYFRSLASIALASSSEEKAEAS